VLFFSLMTLHLWKFWW